MRVNYWLRMHWDCAGFEGAASSRITIDWLQSTVQFFFFSQFFIHHRWRHSPVPSAAAAAPLHSFNRLRAAAAVDFGAAHRSARSLAVTAVDERILAVHPLAVRHVPLRPPRRSVTPVVTHQRTRTAAAAAPPPPLLLPPPCCCWSCRWTA